MDDEAESVSEKEVLYSRRMCDAEKFSFVLAARTVIEKSMADYDHSVYGHSVS